MRKYDIIMPYSDRAEQLKVTLESFERLYGGRDDFSILVVEEGKNVVSDVLHSRLNEVLGLFPSLPIIHIQFPMRVQNPAPLFNYGAYQSDARFLIITNPECKHDNDILKGFDEELAKDENVYVVAACKSLKRNGTFDRWYQHSVYRPMQYHFCSVISTENYMRLKGFPGSFADGYCFDDDAWLWKVKAAKIPVIQRDDLLVSHIWHKKARPDNWKELWEYNRKKYLKLISQ